YGVRPSRRARRPEAAERAAPSQLSFHLDEFELNAVRPFEEAHPAAAGNGGLFQDVDALRLELRDHVVELVGVDGDVLHAGLLLSLRAAEAVRDVELQDL